MRGLVLAGGLSRRFGSDKAEALYKGESFLLRAVKILDELELFPLVVTQEKKICSIPKATVHYDRLPQKGPLGGIETAMSLYPGVDFLVLTCDMPAVSQELLKYLINENKEKPVLTLYALPGEKIEPFPGIYPSGLFPEISRCLSMEKLSMRGLIESISEKNIIPLNQPIRELRNINTVSDLESLRLATR